MLKRGVSKSYKLEPIYDPKELASDKKPAENDSIDK